MQSREAEQRHAEQRGRKRGRKRDRKRAVADQPQVRCVACSWYYANWASPKITVGTWLRNSGCTAITHKCLSEGSNPTIVEGGEGFFCNAVPSTSRRRDSGDMRKQGRGCTFDRSGGSFIIFSALVWSDYRSHKFLV